MGSKKEIARRYLMLSLCRIDSLSQPGLYVNGMLLVLHL